MSTSWTREPCKHGQLAADCETCLDEWRQSGGFARAFWTTAESAFTKPPTIKQGWQCPVCGAVYSPMYPSCDNCKGKIP